MAARSRVATLLAAALMLAIAGMASAADLPIVFVHGNGDTAALWHTTIWRFESNGYASDRLFAIDIQHPMAPADDTKEEENRSTSADQAAALAGFVARALIATGSDKVVLVGNSRGANTIRNYIRFGGGAAHVTLAILCGGVNHGVYAIGGNPNSEFNGAGTFMRRLNGGSEVQPGVRFVTIRSDKLDKYAQPTGEFIGRPGQPTGVGYEAPALEGAENIVLPGRDHREVAFHASAFARIYQAITGKEPATTAIAAEPSPILDGVVGGFANGAPTNLPIADAAVELFEVDPTSGARLGPPAHRANTRFDGHWGPFTAKPDAYYEFVVAAPGYPIHHIYRSPFPRSSHYVNITLKPVESRLKDAAAAITITRPRGYFGHGRDIFTIAGSTPEGVNTGVPGTSTATMLFAAAGMPIPVAFNAERMIVRSESPAAGALAIAEFHD